MRSILIVWTGTCLWRKVGKDDLMYQEWVTSWEWFDNAWHNGTFYGKNVRDILCQCMDINIKPKEIELLEESVC